MIFLDPNNPIIVAARNKHVEKLLPIVFDRVDALPIGGLKNFLNKLRVRRILSDLPGELIKHHEDWLNTINGISIQKWQDYLVAKGRQLKYRTDQQKALVTKYDTKMNEIQSIFKYTGDFAKKTSSYSAYNLAEQLKINTCPYCNRTYTKTVINPKKITRPQFDHWFPQAKYPILALSFHNLIPSCNICNSSIKGAIEMNLKDHLHPYIQENVNIKFSYTLKGLNKYKFKIKTPPKSKERNTIEAFKLEKIYETHKDEIHDLVRLRKLYSADYLLRLKGLLKNVDSNVSMEELYRLAFGVHYEEKDFSKRPLSKMKRDILEELGMILN